MSKIIYNVIWIRYQSQNNQKSIIRVTLFSEVSSERSSTLHGKSTSHRNLIMLANLDPGYSLLGLKAFSYGKSQKLSSLLLLSSFFLMFTFILRSLTVCLSLQSFLCFSSNINALLYRQFQVFQKGQPSEFYELMWFHLMWIY